MSVKSIDEMFSPAGFVVALEIGVEVTVEVGNTVLESVKLSRSDLYCSRCDRPIDPPKRSRARYVALNKALRNGRCRRCTDVGPALPPIED